MPDLEIKDKRLLRERAGFKPVILNHFPQELWVEARVKALRDGETMQSVVIKLFTKWIKGEIQI
jgi:hypothetical protein